MSMRRNFVLILTAFTLLLGVQHAFTEDEEDKPSYELSDEIRAVLNHAEKIELISLEPVSFWSEQFNEKRGLYGHDVLGSTTISENEQRKKTVATLLRAIGEARGAAGCFMPRHALRATSGEKTVELVICFECSNVHVYLNGESVDGTGIVGKHQPYFDDILKAAKVKLANPPKKVKAGR